MKKIFIVLFILLLTGIGLFIWWDQGKQPVNPTDKTQKLFIIQQGENLRDVGYDLKKEGLIRDPIVFFFLVKIRNLDGKIQAGDFRLSPSMSTGEVAETLTHGTLDIWVTIPEGKRATEITDILEKKLPSYKASWKEKLIQEEGYLFPDTYLFPKDADLETVISIMKNNFEKKYAEAAAGSTVPLTKEEVVILASILEREGKTGTDMKTIASVFENRMSVGMALQADATIQYALGYQPVEKSWWKKHLSSQDLKLESPYNSYLHPELPPTPIANPGFEALQAVLHPADTEYVYYVSDKNGKLHFAKNLAEHNANVKKYIE